MKRNQHIVPHEEGWAVKGEKAEKAVVLQKSDETQNLLTYLLI